jgi:rod shape determining protein RodA
MITIAGVLIASTQRQADYADWYHHWITAAFGVLLALGLERLPLQRLQPLLVPVYALTVISLVAVRVIGTTALGAQRWISIGGVHVQPSEFAKIAAILLVAAVLSRHPVERPIDLMRPLGVIAVPWLLVFIQPDLGTSLVFGALMLTMLYWSGMPIEWVILLLSPLVTALLSGLLPWASGSRSWWFWPTAPCPGNGWRRQQPWPSTAPWRL